MNLWRFMNRKAKDAELVEEIASHLAHDEDLRTACGMAADEAHRQARVKFGSQNAVRAEEWRNRSLPWVEAAQRDLMFALRALRKTPGFSIITLTVIAAGIGLNTAVFSVINTVVLKPLTYPRPQEMMAMMDTLPWGMIHGANVPKFNLWRQQKRIFAQLAAYDDGAGMGVTGGDRPLQVQAVHVSADYFSMFGAPMISGRPFTDAEDSPNGGKVVVLSYGLWKNKFGGNAHIVGTTIQLDRQSYLVVGVVGKSL